MILPPGVDAFGAPATGDGGLRYLITEVLDIIQQHVA